MLDTNGVSYTLGGNPPSVREHLRRVPMVQVCFSSITEAELLFRARRENPSHKIRRTRQSIPLGRQRSALGLRRRKSLRWPVRCVLEAGPPLAAMDTLVTAHASWL